MDSDVTYGDLVDLLKSVGFHETGSDQTERVIANRSMHAVVVLPAVRDSDRAASYHLAAARRLLDERGALPKDQFDRLITERRLARAS